MEWFRSYHGAPTDPKWLVIARLAGTQPGVVAAVWWALMDRASQATPRGSVAGFDVEATAAFFGWDGSTVQAVLDALRRRGLIADGDVLPQWRKRNPPDYSTERVQAFRGRKRTVSETIETEGNGRKHRGEEIRGDKTTAADAAVTAATDALTLLGNGGAEALAALRPPGGIQSALASIRMSLLYENESEATPDKAVQGLPIHERRQFVARALVEMASNGTGWSTAALTGFVRRLRSQPTPAPNEGARDQARAGEARRRQSQNEAESRDASEEAAAAKTAELWSWWENDADADTKARVTLAAKDRCKGVPKGLHRAITIGVMQEHFCQQNPEQRASA